MLKLIFSQFLLNVYLLSIIVPVLPIVDYLVNYDYIVQELCINRDKPLKGCNGKCYLDKQVKQQQNLDTEQSTPLPPKLDFEKFLTLKTKQIIYWFSSENFKQPEPSFLLNLKESRYIESLLRPPISL